MPSTCLSFHFAEGEVPNVVVHPLDLHGAPLWAVDVMHNDRCLISIYVRTLEQVQALVPGYMPQIELVEPASA